MWDILQHFQIQKASDEARQAALKTDHQESKVGNVQDQVEKLTLACQAMWELLRDHSGLMESQLKSKMHEIDGRDGRRDGKIAGEVISCPNCGQKTGTQTSRCVFCGKAVKPTHLFKV